METSDSKLEKSYAPHVALLLVQAFFGSLPVIGKIVLKTIPAFGLVGFRVGITAICLLIFQNYRGDLWLAEADVYVVRADDTHNGTLTDLDGNFLLEHVVPGTQTLHIEKGSFSTAQDVEVLGAS